MSVKETLPYRRLKKRYDQLKSDFHELQALYRKSREEWESKPERTVYRVPELIEDLLSAVCENRFLLKDHYQCEAKDCRNLVCPQDIPKHLIRFIYCKKCQKERDNL
jgi:hypothetical protein